MLLLSARALRDVFSSYGECSHYAEHKPTLPQCYAKQNCIICFIIQLEKYL